MFWNNLNEWEADRYWSLVKLAEPWIQWASLSNTKRNLIAEPTKPTDDQLHDIEMLAMKGWNVQ